LLSDNELRDSNSALFLRIIGSLRIWLSIKFIL